MIIEQFKQHAPQIYEVLAEGMPLYNTVNEAPFIDAQYPKTEKTSVDYAIMERAENVYTIPCDIGWSDLGTWNSLYVQSAKDERKNVTLSKPVVFQDAKENLVLSSTEKLVVIRGLDDYIVIDTDDCLLIYPKSHEQEIKQLKQSLDEKGLDRFL